MVRVAHADHPDAVFAGPGDGFAAGDVGEHLADAGATVQQQQRTAVDQASGSVRAVIAPLRSRAAYQGRRSTPWD